VRATLKKNVLGGRHLIKKVVEIFSVGLSETVPYSFSSRVAERVLGILVIMPLPYHEDT
jgi:hypothetical protein